MKGLASHYCSEVWGKADKKFGKPSGDDVAAYQRYLAGDGKKPADNIHCLLFGASDDSGCIIFYDAWHVPESAKNPLVLDVMTPHHPEWIDGSVAPTDFDSPIPVPFLATVGRFLIALSWCGPDVEEVYQKQWLELALKLVQEALSNWGVGGKTTSGYGRLVDPEDANIVTLPPAPLLK